MDNHTLAAVIAMGKKYANEITSDISADISQNVTDWLDEHVDPETGYVIDDTLTIQGVAADAKAVGDANTELKNHLSGIEEVTVVKSQNPVTSNILSTLTWTNGAYMSADGVEHSATTLKYSNKIAVSKGDVLSVNPSAARLRYVCAFSNGVAVSASGSNTSATSYTVPSGIDEVIVTIYMSGGAVPTELNLTHTTTVYANILDDDMAEINAKIDSINDAITTVEFDGDIETEVEPVFTTGAIGKNGVEQSYANFQYTQKISVSAGDVVEVLSSGEAVGLRFVCAYSGESVNANAGSDADAYAYTVPSGIDGVIVTTRIELAVDTVRITSHGTVIASYVKPIPMGYMMERGVLTNGESMTLPFHNVKLNNCYVFNANISSFNSVTFQKTADTYITVNSTNLVIHNDQTEIVVPHGLTIGHNVGLLVENEASYTVTLIRVSSDGEYFDYTTPVRFLMDNGTPTILSTSNLTECTFSWVSKNINCPVWLFGDSYFSWYASRWTYYLAEDGYTKACMLNGYAGQASATAYQALVNLLAVTTPKIVVWCLGMNDPDTDSAVSASWDTIYDKVKLLSMTHGFELVLYTVPTTPTMNNRFKNAIIRESGYRYIEADKAVRINENGDWVSGALSDDEVHPTVIGAKILYSRILADLPELMCNR